MKKYIFYLVAIISVSTVSCRKIEMDGEPIIIEIPGGGGGGEVTGKRVELKGYITKDTTLYAKDNNILTGKVYVENGVTLTIEKGATVKAAYSGADVAVLIVTRGGKIIAEGTQDSPIVFTSSSPTPQSGDWGGIVLCGKASINFTYEGKFGLFQVEGGVDDAEGRGLAGSGDAKVPTPIDDDNSGILKYVRIEYAGYAFQPDKEVNSLTMAGVGNKTVIEHVQVTYAKDDAFEWFGGTVNCKYLIAFKTQDDDFDSDNGFSGSVQFGLIIRDSTIADISKSEAFESDNHSTGGTMTPQTSAVFSNITAFGHKATAQNVGNSNYHGAAVQIRRNSSISIFNSAFVGWKTGIEIDDSRGSATSANITANKLRLKGVIIAGAEKAVQYVGANPANGYTEQQLTDWFLSTENKNLYYANVDAIRFTRPFDYTNPDYVPFGNSPVVIAPANNTYFDDPFITARTYIEKVDFIGAVGPSGAHSNWYKGWTNFQ